MPLLAVSEIKVTSNNAGNINMNTFIMVTPNLGMIIEDDQGKRGPDIDKTCVAQANLAGELLEALVEIKGIVRGLTGEGAFPMRPELAYEHIEARANAAISKAEAL